MMPTPPIDPESSEPSAGRARSPLANDDMTTRRSADPTSQKDPTDGSFDDPTSASGSDDSAFEAIAGEFLSNRDEDQPLDLTEFEAKYPQYISQMRELLPMLGLFENAKESPAPEPPSEKPPLVPREAPLPPPLLQVGRYDVLLELGKGGMGVVYLVHDPNANRLSALKVVKPNLIQNRGLLDRFRREAETAALMVHPHIVPVFDVAEHDNMLFYTMPYVHGVGLNQVIRHQAQRKIRVQRAQPGPPPMPIPLDDLVARLLRYRLLDDQKHYLEQRRAQHDPNPPLHEVLEDYRSPALKGNLSNASTSWRGRDFYAQLANVTIQVAQALEHVHQQGVLHRDIKPSNLILDRQGHLWLTDFGLAKAQNHEQLTRTNEVPGTLRYVAPERFTGTTDARSDLYSLGITLYEALTAHPAFLFTDHAQLVQQICHGRIKPIGDVCPLVPEPWIDVVDGLIALDPDDRYPSATPLIEDLAYCCQ